MEETLRFSDILKQGIKLLIYTTLACHICACFLHVVACYDTAYEIPPAWRLTRMAVNPLAG